MAPHVELLRARVVLTAADGGENRCQCGDFLIRGLTLDDLYLGHHRGRIVDGHVPGVADLGDVGVVVHQSP